MGIKKISLVTTIMLLFSIFLVGCSSSPEKVISEAVKKNEGIVYSKQDVNINISVAGVGGDVKVLGEVDNKAKKGILKASLNAPAMEINNMSIDIYMDNNILYIKDPESDNYSKMAIPQIDGKESKISSTLASELITTLKDDKTLKESIEMKKGENADKVISAKISSETVTKLLEKAVTSKEAISAMESAAESQALAMAEMQGQTGSKEEIIAAAKKEAVEEYKKALKEIKFENIKYTGKVNKEGYLYDEELSFDVKEATTGLTINLKINAKISDINAGKTITIPEIPKEKIVEIK